MKTSEEETSLNSHTKVENPELPLFDSVLSAVWCGGIVYLFSSITLFANPKSGLRDLKFVEKLFFIVRFLQRPADFLNTTTTAALV